MSVRSFASSPLSPHTRGLELGRAHAAQVRRCTGRYADLFAQRGGAGFDARGWAARFREAIGDLEPDALREIDGIAEGAGVDPLDVVALNARTEILAKADPFGERPFVSECSTVLVAPADSPDHTDHPGDPAYAVQTWDWYALMADGWLQWRIPHPDGSWVETVTEHGLLGKIGVSSRGVGVMLNILHHRADAGAGDEVGYPVHLLARRILDRAASAADAVELCRGTPVAASTALTVLDAGGGTGVELFPGGPGVIEPVDGLLVRTNHFLSDAGRAGCLADEASTRLRRSVLDSALRGSPPASADDVLSAMEHHDPEGGVCRHRADGDEEPIETLATVVVEPAPPRLQAYAGGPCSVPTGLDALAGAR